MDSLWTTASIFQYAHDNTWVICSLFFFTFNNPLSFKTLKGHLLPLKQQKMEFEKIINMIFY